MANNLDLPSTLKQSCLKVVASRIAILRRKYHQGGNRNPNDEIPATECQQNFFVSNPVSEELLEAVCRSGQLNDDAAEWLSIPTRFRIRRLYLIQAGQLTTNRLKALLSKHVLTEIHAQNINEIQQSLPKKSVSDENQITVGDIIDSMNSVTKDALQYFNVSRVRTGKAVDGNQFEKLGVLINIRSLNVSYTNFTDNDLDTVIACMQNLKYLNISNTRVRSILYLSGTHAPKLHSLSMNNLYDLSMSKKSLFGVFQKMTELQYLDISTEYEQVTWPSGSYRSVNKAISMMMIGEHEEYGGDLFKNLISLDISGRKGVKESVFLNFYANHPNLEFVGLLCTSLNRFTCFTKEVKVTGDHTEAQIKESLSRYFKRPVFAKQSVQSLAFLLQIDCERLYDKELLKLVLRCMRNHRDNQDDASLAIQSAALVCLHYLVHPNSKPPTRVMSLVVKETLDTMEQFSDKTELQNACLKTQQNCLMVLYKDWILKDVPIDYFETVQLVMRCLRLCKDSPVPVHDVALAIISKLFDNISMNQKLVFESSENMKALLQIVERKINEKSLDDTFKSAINLVQYVVWESRNSYEAMRSFIVNNGLPIFSRLTLASDPYEQARSLRIVFTFVLFPRYRRQFLTNNDDQLKAVRDHLHSQHPQTRYCASGIIASIAMLSEEEWDSMLRKEGLREVYLADLYAAVLSWKADRRGIMVVYQSFKPLFPLLRSHDTPAIQLWATWAIRQVCLENELSEKCHKMLIMEKGVDCLLKINADPAVHTHVRDIVQEILKLIKDTHPHLEVLADV